MRINFKNYDNCWLTQTLKRQQKQFWLKSHRFLCIFFLVFKNLKIVNFSSKTIKEKTMLQSITKSWYTGFQTSQKSSFMLDSKHSIFFLFMIGWHHNPHGISHSTIFEFPSYPFQRPCKIKIDTIDLDITWDQGGRGDNSPRIPLPCTEVGRYRSFSAANCLSMSSSVTRDFDVSPRPLLGAAGACTIYNENNGFLDM